MHMLQFKRNHYSIRFLYVLYHFLYLYLKLSEDYYYRAL